MNLIDDMINDQLFVNSTVIDHRIDMCLAVYVVDCSPKCKWNTAGKLTHKKKHPVHSYPSVRIDK